MKSLIFLCLLAVSTLAEISSKSIVLLPQGKCTGFIIKENLIVTAAHCVNSGNLNPKSKIFLVRFDDPRFEALFSLKKINPITDIAVLEGSTFHFPPITAIRCALPERHSKAITIGYPYIFMFPFKEEYTFQGLMQFKNMKTINMVFSGIVKVGDSGSPIFNAEGEVISMTIMMFDGYPLGVLTFDICDFLAEFSK